MRESTIRTSSRNKRRDTSFLTAKAISEPLNHWQIEEIRKGVAEADRGEFANEKDVVRILKKWTRRLGGPSNAT
jgi:predicted transcriptional regulator